MSKTTRDDLGIGSDAKLKAAARKYPLHLKPISTLSIERLLELHCRHADLRLCLERELSRLNSADEFSGVVFTTPQLTRAFSKKDVTALLKSGRIRLASSTELCGSVNSFWVLELAKCRRRWINEPSANKTMTSYMRILYPRRTERHARALCECGSECTEYGAIMLDFQSYFDAFAMDAKVSRFHRFRLANGEVYELTRLSMGARWSPAVAQLTTSYLTDLPTCHRVRIDTMIDNIRIVGHRTEVIAAATEIIERARAVGLMFNDMSQEEEAGAAATRLFAREGTWLGETYDYANATVRASATTLAKVAESWKRITTTPESASCRNLCALVSLLFWATGSIDPLAIAQFPGLLQLYSRVSSWCGVMGHDDRVWDSPLLMSPAYRSSPALSIRAWTDLDKWAALVLENKPRNITQRSAAERTQTIFVDASGGGWGCVSVTAESCHMFSGSFPAHIGASAHAEPEGVKQAVIAALRPDTTELLIVSDHEPLVFAAKKGFSTSAEAYNDVLSFLHATFPHVTIGWRWLAGADHPADKLSRNLQQPTDGLSREQLRIIETTQRQVERDRVSDAEAQVLTRPPWMN